MIAMTVLFLNNEFYIMKMITAKVSQSCSFVQPETKCGVDSGSVTYVAQRKSEGNS